MGDRERKDSLKVLEGKPILNVKRWRILDYLLYPYRAYKEKKRQEELKKRMFESMLSEPESTDTEDFNLD